MESISTLVTKNRRKAARKMFGLIMRNGKYHAMHQALDIVVENKVQLEEVAATLILVFRPRGMPKLRWLDLKADLKDVSAHIG